MSWKASGDDRGRSYAVYKLLEERYAQLVGECMSLKEQLERKDRAITALASELASHAPTQAVTEAPSSHVGIQQADSDVVALSDAGSIPTPATVPPDSQLKQPPETRRMPGLRKAGVPLSEVVREYEDKRKALHVGGPPSSPRSWVDEFRRTEKK